MSEFGRIHYRFDLHDKVQKCSLAAIGLWTLCNSKCRRHHTSGFIKEEWVEGFEDEAAELCDAGLWHRADDGFRYNDWSDWNFDEDSGTAAMRLVNEVIPPEHPAVVRRQLASKVAELLNDGTGEVILAAALRLWLTKANAGVSLLPHLVSDAVRTNEAGLEALLRRCWKSGNVSPLAAHGHIFPPPDIPADVTTVDAVRQFMLQAKRLWVEQLRKELGG